MLEKSGNKVNLQKMPDDYVGDIKTDDAKNKSGISLAVEVDFDWKRETIENKFTVKKITHEKSGESITPAE